VKVRKAIIPAAGLGTRFLPATKSLPKEMLPIVDTPTIQYIVEEAVASGIEEILIVTNSNKQSIENHFDVNYELETRLNDSNKTAEVRLIRDIAEMAQVFYIRQKEPKGLGHAVLCAKSFVGDEPFAILLGDDVMVNDYPVLKQLIDSYDQKKVSILGVQTVLQQEVSKYGVVSVPNFGDILHKINGIVEKPSVEKAPSCLAVLGRYVLTPQIFEILETQKPGKNNEIQLTDAIETLLDTQSIYAYDFEGERYDLGSKFGYLKANIDFALKNDEIKDELLDYLKTIVK
jgi:UTP--glucose-1-phosphate uridylyltransferase